MNDSLKSAVVNLKATAAEKLTQNTRFEFYSHDYKSGYLLVKMLGEDNKNLVVSNDDTVRIFMRVKDNDTYKHLIYKMTVNDNESGIAELEIPPQILGYVGRVECGVYIEFVDGKTLDVGYFDFKMRKSMIDGEFKELDTIYVKEFSEALEKIKLIAEEYEDKYSTAIEENQEEFSEALEKIKQIAKEYESKYSTAIDESQEEFNLFLNESKKNMKELLESDGLVTAQALKKAVDDVNYVGTNLWAPNLYKDNQGAVNATGAITSDRNYVYTDYLEVGNFVSLVRQTVVVPRSTHSSISYFDKNKNFISRTPTPITVAGNQVYTFPAKTAFIRLNFANPQVHGGKFKVEFGSKPTDYSINPYDIETMFADVKKAVLELSDKVLGGK